MFVILAYDVQSKRVAKVMKVTKKYLRPVQESVFEGFLTESRLKKLKKELQDLIIPEKDSVVIYKHTAESKLMKEELGVYRPESVFL